MIYRVKAILKTARGLRDMNEQGRDWGSREGVEWGEGLTRQGKVPVYSMNECTLHVPFI